jgi:hypothetical protein
MWRCVDLASTDVSEERIAPIFRVKYPRAVNQLEQVAADEPPVRNNQLYKNRERGRLCHMGIQQSGEGCGIFGEGQQQVAEGCV